MKRFLLGLLLGILLGAGGYWYWRDSPHHPAVDRAVQSVADGAGKLKHKVQEAVADITAEQIREELTRTSLVVREKAQQAGAAVADAAANARITGSIKARLIAEPGLSALAINVDTSNGLVTLSGTAESHEQVARAVRIAFNTDGVHKVISTIQIKASGEGARRPM